VVFVYGVVDLSDALKGAQLLPVYEEKRRIMQDQEIMQKIFSLTRIAA
jgi:hypothetical protein